MPLAHPPLSSPMSMAIQSAREGVLSGDGGPFGACVVHEDKIIAVTHNTVLKDKDPTRHAEMNAIRLASQHLNTHILSGCTLYSTAEPCPMCLSAIYWARLDRVVIGVSRHIAASFGFIDAELYEELYAAPEQRKLPCVFGEEQEACETLFKVWQRHEGILY